MNSNKIANILIGKQQTLCLTGVQMAKKMGWHPVTWSRVKTRQTLTTTQIVDAVRVFPELKDLADEVLYEGRLTHQNPCREHYSLKEIVVAWWQWFFRGR